jgi:hypothetical protein
MQTLSKVRTSVTDSDVKRNVCGLLSPLPAAAAAAAAAAAEPLYSRLSAVLLLLARARAGIGAVCAAAASRDALLHMLLPGRDMLLLLCRRAMRFLPAQKRRDLRLTRGSMRLSGRHAAGRWTVGSLHRQIPRSVRNCEWSTPPWLRNRS